jgi:hypothetical protein
MLQNFCSNHPVAQEFSSLLALLLRPNAQVAAAKALLPLLCCCFSLGWCRCRAR